MRGQHCSAQSYINASVGIQNQLKTVDVSALISFIAPICHVYMKFPLKIKDSTFVFLILEKYNTLQKKKRIREF
jgi:hypothetical protein